MRSARVLPALCALLLAARAAGATGDVPVAKGAPRVALSTVPADVPAGPLSRALAAGVTVRALVAASGLVDSARAVTGDPRLRAPAEAAVRWWVFPPTGARGWTTVHVPFVPDPDAEPLRPDVLAMARRAEASGDLAGALDAWVGALDRLGQNPAVNNEWAMRERAIAIAHRMSPPPVPANELRGEARSARNAQLRAVARGDHAELLPRFDHALTGAPWWADAYLWRAGSQAGCGRVADALRSLRAYGLASDDTAGREFASRMIDRLAASDTIGVCAAIKTWRLEPDPRTR